MTEQVERDAKIRYITHAEIVSTAYVDIRRGGDIAHGTDKHTDVAITVRWDGVEWREIKP